MQRETIPYTTTAAGAATVFSRDNINGRIWVVRYVATDSDQADGTITITGEDTGIAVFAITGFTASASTTWYPRAFYHLNTSGAVESGLAEQTETCVLHERIKIVLTNFDNTGVAATGTFYVGYSD